MFSWRNLRFGNKIGFLAVGGVLVTALAMLVMTAWQSEAFSSLVIQESDALVYDDLNDIAVGVYNLVRAQDEAVQQQVNYNLNVARHVLDITGEVMLSDETITWNAANQYTAQTTPVRLPRMFVGDEWLGQNTSLEIRTPVVDETVALVGGTATIFQRINAEGDMLRVATNVETVGGQRAIGTFIPAINPDLRENPVVAAVLAGQTYRGSAYVVNDWYLTAYEPLYNAEGEVIGMLCVGVKQENVESLRQAILETQVGESGYVFVLRGAGDDRGEYIISPRGVQDGVNIWSTYNIEGRWIAQEMSAAALRLEPGETVQFRYRWQDVGEEETQFRVAVVTYYEPWDWVISATAYEEEVFTYRDILESGRRDMLVALAGIALAVSLLIAGLSALLARSIAGPVNRLALSATEIAEGNLELTVDIRQQDEAGVLAAAFNKMTAQLRSLIASLEQQVQTRTQALERRSAYLTASADVARAVGEILDTEVLIQEVVPLIKERFELYYVGLFLTDVTHKWAVLRAGTDEAGARMLERGHRMRVGEGMIGWSIANAEPRIALDVGVDAVRLSTSELPLTRSEAALPLRSRGHVVGALTVQSTEPNAFDESIITVLQTMADQVAVALENARLYSEAQQALQAQRQAYGDLTRSAWQELLQMQREHGYRSDAQGLYPVQTRLEQQSLNLLEQGHVQMDTRTLLVPLRIRNQVLGVLRLQKVEGEGNWTEDELGLVEALVEQLGVALESARLYQESQLREVSQRLISEVTTNIRQTLDVDSVLRTAAREIGDVLQLHDISIRLDVGASE